MLHCLFVQLSPFHHNHLNLFRALSRVIPWCSLEEILHHKTLPLSNRLCKERSRGIKSSCSDVNRLSFKEFCGKKSGIAEAICWPMTPSEISQSPLHVMILAAGNSRRFVSTISKVLHPVGGRPMVSYTLEAAQTLRPEAITCVVSSSLQAELALQALLETYPLCQTSLQVEAKGTADAVKSALKHRPDCLTMHTLVLLGDTPLLRPETLARLAHDSKHQQADVLVVAFRTDNPFGYGRCVQDETGALQAIVEEKDATPEQRQIALCNSGVMMLSPEALALVEKVPASPQTGETYLTALVRMAHEAGMTCGVIEEDADDLQGINTRVDLAVAEATLQQRWRMQALEAGNTLQDPSTTYFSFDTQLEGDVTVGPCVTFGPGVVCEAGAHVGAFTSLEQTIVKKGATVGPFARLRGGVTVGERTTVGNFVEVVRSTVGDDVGLKHLSYIGDTTVGAGSNIGAGVVTCNYDGRAKHKTVVEEGAFVGSNSSLVAPVTVGAQSMVGAGSVITDDVPPNTLALGRARQVQVRRRAKKKTGS